MLCIICKVLHEPYCNLNCHVYMDKIKHTMITYLKDDQQKKNKLAFYPFNAQALKKVCMGVEKTFKKVFL